MKKHIVPLLLVRVHDLHNAARSRQRPTPVTINVYNWGQYISDGTDGYIDVNKAFDGRDRHQGQLS